ncbi:something about silencing protein 10 isoform X2 [Hydra vulgaris]|uniref:something about silencing protein 10 isoform X2 n=1 Tax=Hydra vulgaris TaxID=6087 RepID=UPI001F5E74CA|nr:something about silencing protein 10 isoform X2 [Hydra vulgaris]
MVKKKGKLRRVNPEQKKTIKDPNPNDQEYIYNEVDEFHLSKDKIMLDPSQDYDESDEQVSDEEVLAIGSEESEEEINNADETLNDKKDDDSEGYSDADNDDISDNGDDDDDNEDDDNEDSESEDGIPSSKAWGKSKKAYYDTDIHEEDLLSDEEAQEAAAEEEKEALLLQKQMAERLGSEDFYKCDAENIENDQSSEVTESNVITDYSKLSKREKLEILSKQSPELLPLIEEYKDMLNELKSKYHPLLLMSQKGCIDSKQVRLFVEMKHHILTNYCVNIAFYMALKSSKTFLKGHPVFNALVQHKELLSKLYPVEKDLASQIATLISQYHTGEWESISTVEEVDDNPQELKKKKKEKKSKRPSKMKQSNASLDNIDPLEYYNMVKEQAENEKRLKLSKNQNNEPSDEEDELDEEGKRKITYEMSKNKGLIRKRRKELKNPRVKHRMKFKKAVIKHKGQVREVKKEINRYGGEITGIKSSLARSTKIR